MWIANNWYIALALIVAIAVCGIRIEKWLQKPTALQIESMKEWLLYAVTEAEAELGEKTGQLKLHMVYDMAIDKFSWLSFISFDTFSCWVDEALEQMRDMLKNNEYINDIVSNAKE